MIGGGDSAMEEALFLTRFASKVTLIHRREQFRASKIMLDRAIGHEKINFFTNTTVEEVLGLEKKEVTGLRLRNLVTQESPSFPSAPCSSASATCPTRKCSPDKLSWTTTDNSHPRLRFHRVAGVFACGDVQDRRYRQAITAAGSGCMAALEAEKYLEEHGR